MMVVPGVKRERLHHLTSGFDRLFISAHAAQLRGVAAPKLLNLLGFGLVAVDPANKHT